MSKQLYVLPNGTKVKIKWEGSIVGKGTIIDHNIEKDGDGKLTYYRIKIKDKGLFQMLGLSDEHWLNSFEVVPIK